MRHQAPQASQRTHSGCFWTMNPAQPNSAHQILEQLNTHSQAPPALQAAADAARTVAATGWEPPTWAAIASSQTQAPAPPPAPAEGPFARGWQHKASTTAHAWLKAELFNAIPPASQALTTSQSGPLASRAFTTIPYTKHRAVVEATHPKNAPLTLEAGQYKNSRVSTALKRGRKPKNQTKKKKGSKKEKKNIVDFAHLDAGQYKHSALGLLDFHPVPRVRVPQRPMRTPPLRVSLLFCFNLFCSAALTTMANPERPIIDLIDDGSSTTTIDTEAAATLPNPAASTPAAGPAPGTPEWLRRPNTVQQRHSGSNCPVCLCTVDPAGQGPESCFQWPVCDHQLHLGCMAHLLTHYDRPTCPACRNPWAPQCEDQLNEQCRQQGYLRPQPPHTLASRVSTPTAEITAAPPPPEHTVILCCPRLLLIDPANAELDEAWQELPDFRHLAWAPVHEPSTNTWHPEWVCLRCNATISPQHDLFQNLPPRPTCSQHGPRTFVIDLPRRERGWACIRSHSHVLPCPTVPIPIASEAGPPNPPTSNPRPSDRRDALQPTARDQRDWYRQGPPTPTHPASSKQLVLCATSPGWGKTVAPSNNRSLEQPSHRLPTLRSIGAKSTASLPDPVATHRPHLNDPPTPSNDQPPATSANRSLPSRTSHPSGVPRTIRHPRTLILGVRPSHPTGWIHTSHSSRDAPPSLPGGTRRFSHSNARRPVAGTTTSATTLPRSSATTRSSNSPAQPPPPPSGAQCGQRQPARAQWQRHKQQRHHVQHLHLQ